MPEVWSPEGISKRKLWQSWKEWKKVHFKHKLRHHKYSASGVIVLRQKKWMVWRTQEEVPPPFSDYLQTVFSFNSPSVASMNAPVSMSFVGDDRARLISARSVPRVGKPASYQRAWKYTWTFYKQQKCFFVRWLGCYFLFRLFWDLECQCGIIRNTAFALTLFFVLVTSTTSRFFPSLLACGGSLEYKRSESELWRGIPRAELGSWPRSLQQRPIYLSIHHRARAGHAGLQTVIAIKLL